MWVPIMKNKLKNKKKPIIIIASAVIIIAAVVILVLSLKNNNKNNKSVSVVPVAQISTPYWGNESQTYGTITNELSQELYPLSTNQSVEIMVSVGQSIKKGDILVKYDSTKLDLEVQRAENKLQGFNLNLSQAQSELTKLKNTTPIAQPSAPEIPKIRDNDPGVSVYSNIDVLSSPYKGTGTKDDPYIFLCDEKLDISPDFLKLVFGLPYNKPADDSVIKLSSPCSVKFERREENSMYGPLKETWSIDGTSYSGKIDTSVKDETSSEKTSSENENEGQNGYTSEQLAKMIKDKQAEIDSLNASIKQAEIDLRSAKFNQKNAIITATADGNVTKLLGIEEARSQNSPFLVVSGSTGYYIKGYISEDNLDTVTVGNTIFATSWETGGTYSGEIVSINENPVSTYGNNNGSGNQNSSTYEFAARIDDAQDIRNGMYLNISLSSNMVPSNALYLWKAYIRSDTSGSYVLKLSSNGRLEKTYISIGKTIYNEYTEILEGVTPEDNLAFPYGDAEDGVKGNLSSENQFDQGIVKG